jgi:GNAT superfamily N-acetyltransferase
MIEVVSASTANLTEKDYQRLFKIVTDAYAKTEEEVWGKNYVRIPYEEYIQLLKDGKEMILAYLDDELVGSVRYYERELGIYTFSLLSADFDKMGQGIGRALVQEVERRAKAAGAKYIQIEILRARAEDTYFKTRLADWYQRIGYQYTHSEDFAKLRPEKAKKLVQPSDFDYYQKSL